MSTDYIFEVEVNTRITVTVPGSATEGEAKAIASQRAISDLTAVGELLPSLHMRVDQGYWPSRVHELLESRKRRGERERQ